MSDATKLPQIQIARAIAALMVVYFHSYMGLSGINDPVTAPISFISDRGYLGVNLFFCISGYIIGLVCDRPNFSPLSFLTRRFFRIYPVFWLFLAAAFVFHRFHLWPPGIPPIDAAELTKNIALFPIQGNPIYSVSWSLEHEIIFYVLAAIAVRKFGVPGLLILVTLLGAVGQVTATPQWDYHLFASAQLDFATGLLIYYFRSRLASLGFTGPFLSSVALYVAATHDISYAATFAQGLLLTALLNIPSAFALRRLRSLVLIGDASYSLYLMHWLVTHVMAAASVHWLAVPGWAAEPYRAIIIATSIGGALLIFRFVERPVIRLGHVMSERWRRKPIAAARPYRL